MSINRLRSVAVRMRPAVPTSDGPTEGQTGHVASGPRRVVASRPAAIARRQIWDLQDETRSPNEPVPAEASSARVESAAPASVVRPSPAKTRIIGFHAEAIAGDIQPEAASGPAYPAGFLVVTDGPGRGAHFVVTTRVSTIGRGEDQDIRLDFGDENISRAGHASVMFDAEQNRFFLGHGNKANAVRRNDRPVLATEELEHGDVLRIGKTSLRFHAFCGADFSWGGPDHD